MKTIWILLLAIGLFALDGCNKKEKARTLRTTTAIQPTTPTPPTHQPQKEDAPQPKTEVKAAPHYFLIAGCFEYRSNAEKLVEKLKGEGFADAEVLSYYENLYLVSYSGYPTRQEAVEALETLRQNEECADAWIHHTK